MCVATVSTGTRVRRSTLGRGNARGLGTEPTWGIWRVPDSELHVLPENLAGKDVIELGCGTAYIAAWLAPRGACGRDGQLCGPTGDGPPASVNTDSR